jgi:hypothetical protein
MERSREDNLKVDIKYNAIVLSGDDLENWAEEVFDRVRNALTADGEWNKLDVEKKKDRIRSKVYEGAENLWSDTLQEKGPNTVVIIVKDKHPEGFVCDIMPAYYLYARLIDAIEKALIEDLVGNKTQTASLQK